jgi:hypothetical protein
MNLKHALRTALVAVFTLMASWSGKPGVSGISRVRADDTPAAQRSAAWVDKRIEEWQPTKAERAFDEIGWAKDLGEARRLAEQHGRPIFLFTYDGADLACYRC